MVTVENDHIHDINELNRNINVVEAEFTKWLLTLYDLKVQLRKLT